MISREEILQVLPHRYPFLFVDKIAEIDYLKTVVGYKNVSSNEPWVTGHFPDDAVFPGVLLIETAAQVCGFLFYDQENRNQVGRFYLTNVKDFKFTRVIRPGDQIEIRGEYVRQALNFVDVQCKAFVDGQKAAVGSIRYYFENLPMEKDVIL